MACPRCGIHCTCASTGDPARARTLVYDSSEFFPSAALTAAVDELETETSTSFHEQESHVSRRIAVNQSTTVEASYDNAQEAAWRDEVASRVLAHRAKRRKRFDPDASLSLGFEVEAKEIAAERASVSSNSGVGIELEENSVAEPMEERSGTYDLLQDEDREPAQEYETQAQRGLNIYERMAARAEDMRKAPTEEVGDDNVILFPRAATVQTSFTEELAEPISPRILDVPEEVMEPLAPPPLATIQLDDQVPDWIKNYDEDEGELALPLQVAPMGPRMLASAMDGVLVLTAAALFSLIVLSVAKFVPQGRMAMAIAVVLPTALWTVYHYIFLVFGGITPGMMMAQLELSSFEGCVPLRRTRATRALALLLSCASLGLGFAWAVLDEDSLGWHDRITRTYLRQS